MVSVRVPRGLLAFAKERLRLRHVPDVEYTDEDALQSGTRTFLEDIVAGKIDRFDDEVGTLRILRRIIADKVSARAQMRAIKRDRSRIRRWMGEIGVVISARGRTSDLDAAVIGDGIDLYQSGVPGVEVHLIAKENLARLMDALEPELQMIAWFRLRFTIPDAAKRVGVSESSFKRRLAMIREIWITAGLVDEHHSSVKNFCRPIRKRHTE